MGLFLSMSGVIGCTYDQIQVALKEYAEEHLKRYETLDANTLDTNVGAIATSSKNTIVVFR